MLATYRTNFDISVLMEALLGAIFSVILKTLEFSLISVASVILTPTEISSRLSLPKDPEPLGILSKE